MSVANLDRLLVKLDRIADADVRILMRKAISVVQEAAKSGVRVKTGELRGSIYTDVKGTERAAVGECYTNKEYASYVEFGTGPNGAKNHAGISPNVAVSYRQTGWIIPASAMSEAEAKEYGFGVAKGKDGEVIGYYTKGQPARPFMYPAVANHTDEIQDVFKKYVESKVGEL